jgi:hypothetical protein
MQRMTTISGALRKMTATLDEQNVAQYQLTLDTGEIPLNAYIGQPIQLTYLNKISCCHCGRTTKKSYSQGFCFPCMQTLAQCDMCIMKPETCHFAQGTCREPDWAEQHCMTPHFVYLANTSGLKVGITRHSQIPTRWIDQGATQALPIAKVSSRYISGLVEVALAQFIQDKTNWRVMLKGNADSIDLIENREQLLPQIEQQLAEITKSHGEDCVDFIQQNPIDIHYPVLSFPKKVVSLNFDKQPIVSGTLLGIKGQYLLLDTGVINLRKFTSYHIQFN